MKPVIVWTAVVGILAVLSGAQQAIAECDTCAGAWDSLPPFEQFQMYFNPYTVGLPVGAEAPPIEGVEFGSANTLVVAVHTTYDPDYLPLVAAWAALPEIRVVVLAASVTGAKLRDLRQALGDSESALIADPQATILCATYYVGARPGGVTFLVDRAGTILYRRRGFPLFAALELDRIVRAFAASGTIPADALMQHVLWYGDQAPWPNFPLYDLARRPVDLLPGRPRLVYFGPAFGNNAVAFGEIDSLRTRYPEVEFVWLLSCRSDDSTRAMYDYAHTYGSAATHPEVYDVPFEDFLARYDRDLLFFEMAKEALPAAEGGWTVLFDLDSRLGTHWNLYVSRSILILDADGTVLFPCTLFPINLASGAPVAHPQAAAELARVLDEMLGR